MSRLFRFVFVIAASSLALPVAAQEPQSLVELLKERTSALHEATGILLQVAESKDVVGIRVRAAKGRGACQAEVKPGFLVDLGAKDPAAARAKAVWSMLYVYGRCASLLSEDALATGQQPLDAHAYALLTGLELGVTELLGAPAVESYAAFWSSACPLMGEKQCSRAAAGLDRSFEVARELSGVLAMAELLSRLGYVESARENAKVLQPYIGWSGRVDTLVGYTFLHGWQAGRAQALAREVMAAPRTGPWAQLAFLVAAARPIADVPPGPAADAAAAERTLKQAAQSFETALEEAPGYLPACTGVALARVLGGAEQAARAEGGEVAKRLSGAGDAALEQLRACGVADDKGAARIEATDDARLAALSVLVLARVAKSAALTDPEQAGRESVEVTELLSRAHDTAKGRLRTPLVGATGFDRWLWARQRADKGVLATVLEARAAPPTTEQARAEASQKLRAALRPKQGRGVADGTQEAVAWLLPPTPPVAERPEVAAAIAEALAEQLGQLGSAGRGDGDADVLDRIRRGESRPTVPVPLGGERPRSYELALGRDAMLVPGPSGEKVVVLAPETVAAMMAEPEGAAAADAAATAGPDVDMREPANTLRLLAPPREGRCPRWLLPGGVVVTTCDPVGMTTFPGFGTLEQFQRPFP